MRCPPSTLRGCAAALIFCAAAAAAHDDPAALERLVRGPLPPNEQVMHWFERANIAQADGWLDQADSLLDCIAQVAPGTAALAKLRARVQLDRDRPARALRVLDECRDPAAAGDARIAWLRIEALVRLGRVDAAAQTMDDAVTRFGYQSPEQVLMRADVAAQRRGEGLTAAIAHLDDGLARWPGAWPLVSRALDLERSAGRFDAALARLDALLAGAPDRVELHVLRGDVLAQAGRALEACEAWSVALDKLAAQHTNRAVDRALAAGIEDRLRSHAPRPAAGGTP